MKSDLQVGRSGMDDYLKNRSRLENIARKKEYVFNANSDWVDQVIRLMTNNYLKYGKYYCPCKQSHPLDPENDPICPCPEMDEEVKRDGHCHCRLFFSPSALKERMNILETITCPG